MSRTASHLHLGRHTSARLLAALAALGTLGGCLTVRSPAASRIREADGQMVSGCRYVGEVFGAEGRGPEDVAFENARTRALEQAAAKGATHVVWNALVAGGSPSVSGKAYRCPSPASDPDAP